MWGFWHRLRPETFIRTITGQDANAEVMDPATDVPTRWLRSMKIPGDHRP
jgi:hypothetical protein